MPPDSGARGAGIRSAAAPAAQTEALDVHSFKLFRTDTTRASDTAESLLQRLGLVDPAAAAFLRSDAAARQALAGTHRPHRHRRSQRSPGAAVTDRPLDHRRHGHHFQRLVIEKTPQGFVSRLEVAPLVASTRLASGTIRSSLFAATDEARIPDAVATQVAEIFSGDIDFHRALRKGDRFSVVYETLEADGEPLRTGRVLSAEFVNAGKTFQAMWFQEPRSAEGRLLHPGRPEPAPRVPGVSDGVFARDQRFRHAHPPDSADHAGPSGR